VNFSWFHKLRRSTRLPIVAAGRISTTRQISALQKIGWTLP
jgi:phosphoribosylformimino-5-aminoimidazole carboxamide ribonucleotide (ProFAR) isomerase